MPQESNLRGATHIELRLSDSLTTQFFKSYAGFCDSEGNSVDTVIFLTKTVRAKARVNQAL